MKNYQLFINNKWVDASDKGTFETQNPATGETLAKISKATAGDIDTAVEAAKKAFESGIWSDLSGDERAEYMLKAANILDRRRDEFIKAEVLDAGKPISEATGYDIPVSIRAFEYYGNLAREVRGQVIPIADASHFDYLTYEPYGVIGVISPWNFPLHLFTRGLCPALAAGNTVVIKPASLTPLTAMMMGEVFEEAGFPPGVVNIVPGSGGVAGNALLEHKDIKMISFTGSEEVGRQVLHKSADAPIIKKVTLELGGKGAFIAAPDCDIDAAVDSVLVGFCLHQGQVCCASSRLYLHESIYDKFLTLLVKRANAIRLGDTLDPATQLGSMIDANQIKIVDGFVKRAVSDGAKLLCGGETCVDPPFDKGHFYRPTILECKDNSMECVQEEIFGPVLVVLKYSTDEEAVALANDNRFGLGATIWSEDVRRLYHMAKLLDAGTIWMNTNIACKMESPYGGNNNSGIGRENGLVGLLEYMKVKNNMIYVGKDYANPYGFR